MTENGWIQIVLFFAAIASMTAPMGSLYGMLVMAILSVFIAGLMVGRTPVALTWARAQAS